MEETYEAAVKRSLEFRVALLPRHRVYVWPFDGDGPRFAGLFRETWRRLPLWARRRVLSHWRTPCPLLFFPGPLIELLPDWSRRERRTLAEVSYDGYKLRFRSVTFDAMPDGVACDLIAHELAHVLQEARGIRVGRVTRGVPTYVRADGSEFGGPYEIEEDADLTMSHWGFDHDSIDEWARATGRSKVRKVSLEAALMRVQRHGG